MCGFIGIFKKTFDINFDKVVPLLLHRGPDEIGYFKDENCSLYSSRLAIRDINAGQQPYTKKHLKKYNFLSYNGEIYNFNRLKKKNRNIKSDCDTELIYEIFRGNDKQINRDLNLLDGQFAICFYNSQKRILYLARDKLGEKPLYWSIYKKSIIFASEIKSLLYIKKQKPKFDNNQIMSLNYFWSTHPSKTPYKNIFSLEPGSIYKFNLKGYFTKKFYEKLPNNFSIDNFFKEKSKNIHVSDKNVGVYLSGGIDSYLSSKFVSKKVKNLKSFGVGFQNKIFDESDKQKKLSKILKTTHHKINFKSSDFFKNILEASFYAEIPNTRFAHIPMFLLSKKAKEKKTSVIITGEGADEFFLGYDSFLENFIINNIDKIRNVKSLIGSMYLYMPQKINKNKFINYKLLSYKNLNKNLKKMSSLGINISRYQMGNYFKKKFFPNCKKTYYLELKKYIKHKYKNFDKKNNIKKTQIFEIETLLSGNLLSVQGDRMSMANSIETRSPYLDKNLLCLKFKGVNDLYNNYFGQKPILKKYYYRDYKKNRNIFNSKFPFRSPDNYILSKNGKDLLTFLIKSNKKNGFLIDKKKIFSLFDELIKSKYNQPSRLQALTLLTNMHAVFYALSNLEKYLPPSTLINQFKKIIDIKNKEYELKIFKK